MKIYSYVHQKILRVELSMRLDIKNTFKSWVKSAWQVPTNHQTCVVYKCATLQVL